MCDHNGRPRSLIWMSLLLVRSCEVFRVFVLSLRLPCDHDFKSCACEFGQWLALLKSFFFFFMSGSLVNSSSLIFSLHSSSSLLFVVLCLYVGQLVLCISMLC